MSPEQDHIARARDGSAEAFTALVVLYQVRIRGYLARWVRDDATVDDLAQEVFMAAWRNLPGFAGEVPFGAWLAGIARNQALNHLRGQRRAIDRTVDPLAYAAAGWRIADLDAAADRLAARLEDSERLGRCLERLDERQRELIEQHYFAERSCEDIARARGQSNGAVRIALMRVRQALRACIERQDAEAAS